MIGIGELGGTYGVVSYFESDMTRSADEKHLDPGRLGHSKFKIM
jgi:hypothetical protein